MSNKKETSPTLKRSWFQELKLEFKKISWPNKNKVVKETVAVLVSAILLGLLIVLVDYVLQLGLNFIY